MAPSTQELGRLRRRRPTLGRHAHAARRPLAAVPRPRAPAGRAGVSERLRVVRHRPLVLLVVVVVVGVLVVVLVLRSSVARIPAAAACSLLSVQLVARVLAQIELGKVLAERLHALRSAAARHGAVHYAVSPLGRFNLVVTSGGEKSSSERQDRVICKEGWGGDLEAAARVYSTLAHLLLACK